MTKYYKVLAGAGGEEINNFIDNGYFGIGYDAHFDLNSYDKNDLEEFRNQIMKQHPEFIKKNVNKLWRIYSEIKSGDLLLLFVKELEGFKIGTVVEEYLYADGERYPHRRKVNWDGFILKDKMSTGLKNAVRGPTVLASLENRESELGHLIFGQDWDQNQEENIVDKESKELVEAIEQETTKHHIYVYTYDHYVAHQVRGITPDNPIERTYYKVGRTSQGYKNRVNSQKTTALPEPIIVYRAYKLSDEEESLSIEFKDALIVEKENIFHDLLEAAGHSYEKQKSKQGEEWFLTSLELLDKISEALKMQRIVLDDFDR